VSFKIKKQCKIVRDFTKHSGSFFLTDDEGNILFDFENIWSDEQVWKVLEIANQAFQYGLERLDDKDGIIDLLTTKIQLLEKKIKQKERSEKLLQSVYKISELTSDPSLEIDDFYKQIHEIVGNLVDASNFYICKINTAESSLDFVYYRDSNHDNGAWTTFPSRKISDGFTELVIRSGKTVLLSRKEMENLCAKGITKRRVGISNSWLGVPLVDADRIIGVIAVQSYLDNFTYSEADINLLNFVSQHVSSALKRRELVEFDKQKRKSLEFYAEHDALTKLPNRASIYSSLGNLIQDSKFGRQNVFSILFIDLDGFKQVNDSFGHHIGDSLLKIVADRLRSIIRVGDKVGRLGGDEFIVLLTDIATRDLASEISGRIVSDFALPFSVEGCEVNIGASIGIVYSDVDYESADEMIRAADEAMYKAKKLGKNRYQELA
jgi:diguanylate cyclase (GGDEF)-like protein